MPKCDLNKVVKQLYLNRTVVWVFSCKFAAYFQNTFSQEHLWMAASVRQKKEFFFNSQLISQVPSQLGTSNTTNNTD